MITNRDRRRPLLSDITIAACFNRLPIFLDEETIDRFLTRLNEREQEG